MRNLIYYGRSKWAIFYNNGFIEVDKKLHGILFLKPNRLKGDYSDEFLKLPCCLKIVSWFTRFYTTAMWELNEKN